MSKRYKKSKGFTIFFDKMATRVTKASGKPAAFIGACALIILWGITGPLFKFSDTWQLVINKGTTPLSFFFNGIYYPANTE